MAGGKQRGKIERAFTEQVMPLYDVWCKACHLDDVECEILRLKLFDENQPNEQEILDILGDKWHYYYSERAFRKHWRKIRRKIEGVLP